MKNIFSKLSKACKCKKQNINMKYLLEKSILQIKNEFYNTIANVEFARGIITIYLVKYFLERVNFRKVKIK